MASSSAVTDEKDKDVVADKEKKSEREPAEPASKDKPREREGSEAPKAKSKTPKPEPSRAVLPEVVDEDDDDGQDYPTPSMPPPPPAKGPWRSYKELVAEHASRIVDAQRPIRVLQSLRWPASVEEDFVKSKYRELPKVGDYSSADLGFDVKEKARELDDLARDIETDLGADDAIGQIMVKTALEYRDVCRMLEARGTPRFYAYSRKLYGSPKDVFPDGKSTVRDLGHVLYEILTHIDSASLGEEQPRNLSAEKAAQELNKRFAGYFGDDTVRVEIDDELFSDAAAGSDYVKVRSGAKFSMRDIDILEVHEGWVHVATSLNGQAQTVAKWLAKGPPRTTTVQEGLAALVEIFTLRTYPLRARRLNDRVIAVDKAEDGANFLEVFEWYRTEGYGEEECWLNTRRIFRGGVIEGGAPFTKDASYCKGIVLNYAFIRAAIQQNRADLIPFLFAGKVAHEDVPVLARRANDGVVKVPTYLPYMFRDLNGLAIWMAYSTFFSRLGDEETTDYYAKLFRLGS